MKKNDIFKLINILLLVTITVLLIANLKIKDETQMDKVYENVSYSFNELNGNDSIDLDTNEVYIAELSMQGIVTTTTIKGNENYQLTFNYFSDSNREQTEIYSSNGKWLVNTSDTFEYNEVLLTIYELN